MKKIYTILTFLAATSIFATDRFVDPNLSSGNGTTLFTTITSAVNAAANGDRIIIASSTYNEPELTISKSLQIMPQTPGTTINFNANIIISGFAGMKFELAGFNLGLYSISSNAIPSGSFSDRAKVSIINCSAANIGFDNDFYELNLIKSNITSDVSFRFGNIVSNNMANCYLGDEDLSDINAKNKNFIVGNFITNDAFIYNDNYKFIIANNSLNNLYVSKWLLNISQTNYIINNEFITNCKLYFALLYGNASYNGNANDYFAWNSSLSYNFKFVNNKFIGPVFFANRNTSLTYPGAFGCLFYGSSLTSVSQSATYTTISEWPNVNASGFFDWSYNGLLIPHNLVGGLVYTNVSGPSNEIDGGNPNHDYYDIDLTINDRGINGGPYSQLNYSPTSNPNNSKAFIFDLEMPTDLFPGQSIDIKAKGYHKN